MRMFLSNIGILLASLLSAARPAPAAPETSGSEKHIVSQSTTKLQYPPHFSLDQIKRVLQFRNSRIEWIKSIDVVWIQVLQIQEEKVGTRSYRTGYKSRIMASTAGRAGGTEILWHYGKPYLKPGHYLVCVREESMPARLLWFKYKRREHWIAEREIFLALSEAEASAAIAATQSVMDSLLAHPQILPDSVLSEVAFGKLDLVIGEPGKYSEGGPAEIAFNTLSVQETLVGRARKSIPVALKAPSPWVANRSYVFAVSAGNVAPERIDGVEIYPGNWDRVVKLHRDRIRALQAEGK